MTRRWIALYLSVAFLATAATAAAAMPPRGLDESGQALDTAATANAGSLPLYIIQVAGEPAATYRGGLPGYKGTTPEVTGAEKLDAESPATVAYVNHLEQQHGQVGALIDGAIGRHAKMVYDYQYAYNGFAMNLTPSEAAEVAKLPGVEAVILSKVEYVDTDAGPKWIGAPSVWDGSMVPGGVGSMGEGVIVGEIDTGINTDHPSFAAVGGDGYVHHNPRGHYYGFCDPENPHYGEFPDLHCNDKLIGLYSYDASGGMPEDDNGHGSHTASTAAGNKITATLVAPTMIYTTPLSGVAPHANIIAYDVCTNTGGCPNAATVAAINDATRDGVDVINYSISQSTLDPWSPQNAVLTAFFNARKAGVKASVSAGNSGPGPFTTAAIGPYMTSVGASTHNRVAANALINMTGGDTEPPADIFGRAFSAGWGPAPIVYAGSGSYLKSDGTPDDGQCLLEFPPDTFHGEIVVCDRGQIARVAKGHNVLVGGAGGLILANTIAEGNSTVGDAHELPAVHISYDDGVVLKDWLSTGTGHMGTIKGSYFDLNANNGDIMAAFSSRGPTTMGTCCVRPGTGFYGSAYLDILKPDITAPGVDILAAFATDQADPSPNPEFEFLSGTSMSSPHVAGSYALLTGVHRDWTAAEALSALASTAVTEGVRKEDGTTPADPFDMGSGRINVGFAANAGFVLDAPPEQITWANPRLGGDPKTINLASLTDFSCLNGCQWTRTIKSVRDVAVDYTVTTSSDSGLTITAEPQSFTLAPGEEQAISVTVDATNVMLDDYAFGLVHLTPGSSDVSPQHLTIAIRRATIAFPTEVTGENPPIMYIETAKAKDHYVLHDMRTVDTDPIEIHAHGFVKPTVQDVVLPGDPSNQDPFNGDGGTVTELFDVPAGAMRLVAETKASTAPDLDLWIGMDLNDDGMASADEVVCQSAGGSWQELCDMRDPIEGKYWVHVVNFTPSNDPALPNGDEISFQYGFITESDMTASATGPDSVSWDNPYDVDIRWDLDAINPGDLLYGVLLLEDGASGDRLTDIGVDLVGVEAPGSIYLPVGMNREAPVEQP